MLQRDYGEMQAEICPARAVIAVEIIGDKVVGV
jgi:hypothetical protein